MVDALIFVLGGITIALILGMVLFVLKWIEWHEATSQHRAKKALIAIIIFVILAVCLILAIAWISIANLLGTQPTENTTSVIQDQPLIGSNDDIQNRTLGMIGILMTLFGISIGLLFQSEALIKGSDPLRIKEETKGTAARSMMMAIIFFAAGMIWFAGILAIYWITSPLIANVISVIVIVVFIVAFYSIYKRGRH